MIAGAVALVLVAALAAAVKFTDWGVAMRSAAEDGETASLMGIRLNRVAAGGVGAGRRAGRDRRAVPDVASRPRA